MDKSLIESLRKEAVDLVNEREKLIVDLQIGQNRLADLNGAIVGIDQLLKLKGVDLNALEKTNSAPLTTDKKDLPQILESVMSDRRYRSLDEVIEAVISTGFDFGDKSPKKAVGFTLLGLSRGKRFVRDEDNGQWMFRG